MTTKIANRLPLRRDEKLWAAFEEDRQAEAAKRNMRRPDNCVNCSRPLRPTRTLASDYPGTVRHRAKGRCEGCVKRSERKKANA